MDGHAGELSGFVHPLLAVRARTAGLWHVLPRTNSFAVMLDRLARPGNSAGPGRNLNPEQEG